MSIIEKLICDYKNNGQFIETDTPSFSWVILSDKQNVVQESYRITVTSCDTTVWDSGVCTSSESIHVPYAGAALMPMTKYCCLVTIVDNYGEQASSSTSFETGLLGKKLIADWIFCGHTNPADCSDPIHIFSKSITLQNKKIAQARLFASAMGIFELEINGKRVGNSYFTPGNVNYKAHIPYVEFDINEYVDANMLLRASVANGWYLGRVDNETNLYGDCRAFLCELHIEYEDGTCEVFCSDESWTWTDDGPIRFSDIYDGESYDARAVPSNFRACSILPNDKAKIPSPNLGVPITTHEILHPVGSYVDKDGATIVDFGQNFAGCVKFTCNAQAGDKITITHAELILDGEFFTENLCTAKATLTYICKDGENAYMPHFTYMGFRYVRIVADCNLDILGVVMHSDIERIGSFECSNEKINQLQSNIWWSEKSNFFDIPTDCPQRDERLGWTGDITVFASTATFNAEISLFMRKWLFDLETEQVDGVVPFTIPEVGILDRGIVPTAGWSDAATFVPWAVYMASGDKDILRRQYCSMKAWVDAEKRCCNERLIWEDGFQFGDWLAPDGAYNVWKSRSKWLASCYFAKSADILASAAKILGNTSDAEKYSTLAAEVRAAFVKEFVNDDGSIIGGFQSAYVCALWFSMLPDSLIPLSTAHLVTHIKEHGGLLNTGFLGTPYLTFALSDNGELEEAYKMLLNEECPSWLYPVNLGATTVWERWDGIMPNGGVNIYKQNGVNASNINMVSFNHYAYGAIGDWLYRRVAGLDNDLPGYKHFFIAPHVGGKLSFATATHNSPYGLIECGWRLDGGTITVCATVPVNTTATVVMPSGMRHEIGSGKYEFCEEMN